ncbi:hypothetical protein METBISCDRAFT_15198 [Metschnikowia bicuspidata]|uniref:t-SNARE coiled-coil homology domain-containing protein n=1 Tax=Metschnikowia bicuspidata TaxID=27322 RepID=A0A4P9ZFC2_9ASCO|nr:hypothetical protein METBISCDRAFT_15198 [Metschnikowia bicuspidata]
MGIKKMFLKKEPSEQELREGLQRAGIATRIDGGREEKFGAFRTYAQERLAQKQTLAPVNPYANMSVSLGNPYASGVQGGNPYTQASGQSATGDRNPYSSGARNDNPYSGNPNGYGNGSASGASKPYSVRSARVARDDQLTLDLNDVPSIVPPVRFNKPRGPVPVNGTETLDLNELPEDDLNVEVDDFLPEEEQVNSEDEEVEAIKQEIRFTKQESLALTRNTLRMAQEADAAGTNTLGMLGSQSERLYNAEQNLLLADTQTKIAERKVKHLNKLNRSIFIPVAAGNPFNKKSKLRAQEMKLKTEKEQEKYLFETNRQGVYVSEQRVKQGITNSSTTSDTYNKYQGEKHLSAAQRYQFENDSDDDEIEKELGANLDQIHAYSCKLKNTATVISQEVDAQSARLRGIEENADRLDIKVHLNSSRLSNIR